MATSQMSQVIPHLRSRLPSPDGAGQTDGRLLEDYISRHDQAALAALVRRHGPMVWGVCRRVLRNYHDAEDAFQATFLVLVRKAASIVPRAMLANWLYGVAHQTALKARATAAKRKGQERQVQEMPEPAAVEPDLWRDLQPLLDEELSCLPDKYRAVLVVCDLQGKTRREAALQLRVPEGTVAGRLARARTMLARRLTRRGVALSGGVLAAVLSRNAASAGAPTSVVSSAIEAARLLAAETAAAGAIPVKAAALAEGVLKAMMITKLKAVAAIVLALGLILTGATLLTGRMAAAQGQQPPAAAEKPAQPPQKGEKLPPAVEEKLKWGEPVNGLRAAIAIRPVAGAKPGDKPDLYLVVQNTSKDPLRFSNATEAPEPGRLYLRGDGVIKWALRFKWPTQVDVALQPDEAAFLPLFAPLSPPNPKVGPSVGSTIADDVLKLPRYSLVAHMDIEKPPAGAWTGKLITAETSGAAAEIRSDPPPAGEKNAPEKQEKQG